MSLGIFLNINKGIDTLQIQTSLLGCFLVQILPNSLEFSSLNGCFESWSTTRKASMIFRGL
jgi:hypothetical protein